MLESIAIVPVRGFVPGLSGTIPDALISLPLTTLVLDNNNLTGVVPDWVIALSFVHLNGNAFTGPCPAPGLNPMGLNQETPLGHENIHVICPTASPMPQNPVPFMEYPERRVVNMPYMLNSTPPPNGRPKNPTDHFHANATGPPMNQMVAPNGSQASRDQNESMQILQPIEPGDDPNIVMIVVAFAVLLFALRRRSVGRRRKD